MHMQLSDKGRCICMHLELDRGRQEDKFYQRTPIISEQYVCVASVVATHVTPDYWQSPCLACSCVTLKNIHPRAGC
jgi:hypothetical protein